MARPVELKVLGFDLRIEEHPRYFFHFEGLIPPRGRLTVQDNNYSDSEGTSRLAIVGRDGVGLRGDDLPADVDGHHDPAGMAVERRRGTTNPRVVVDYEGNLDDSAADREPALPCPPAPGTVGSIIITAGRSAIG